MPLTSTWQDFIQNIHLTHNEMENVVSLACAPLFTQHPMLSICWISVMHQYDTIRLMVAVIDAQSGYAGYS